jgi:hypothetical protein
LSENFSVDRFMKLTPELELSLPVDERGQGNGDDEGASAVALLVQRVEEGDGLDGFAQAHLVGQDDVRVPAPAVASPVEAFQLE